MANDPLYGDRPKPPLVPMSNEQVIGFDAIEGLQGASTVRRGLVIGGIALGFAVIALVTLGLTSSGNHTKVQRADTPHQALVVICHDFTARERSYTTHALDKAAFTSRLASLQGTEVAFDSPSIERFERDLASVADQLRTYDTIAGPALDDLRHVCA
jgi:hypothetical protein